LKKTARIRLTEERKHRGWTQQELAERLGTTQHNVSRWESGQTTPGPYFRAKLCALFGKDARELGLLSTEPILHPGGSSSEPEGWFTVASSVVPSYWSVPYRRNPFFTGRDQILAQLDRQFASSAEDLRAAHPSYVALTQPQAITGLGGIGKTQIALEYAYRASNQGRYRHVFWVNAASEEAILSSFRALANLLAVAPFDKETDQQLVQAVKGWLEQSQQPWLLIFDNADEASWLSDYVPQRGLGSVLLTTRAHAVGALAAAIEVESMSLVEGTLLLLQRTQRQQASDDERNEAANVVIALDGFPLALDQAGAYIEETGCSFRDYLHLYQEHHQMLLARRGVQATNYPDSVATTWSLSFQKLAESNPAATEFLHVCAFLAPDAIPEELFTEGTVFWPVMLQQAVNDRLAFNRMLGDLLRFSLISRRVEARLLSIHRLVQVIQRERMGAQEQRRWAEQVVRVVHALFPADPAGDLSCWPQCLRYLEQARACAALLQQYTFQFPEAAALLDRVGVYLSEQALYRLAELLHQQALGLWEALVGPDHPQVAETLFLLATLALKQERYEQAERLYQRTLSLREAQVGPDHPDMARSLVGLAELFLDEGKYEQAEPLLQRALSICEHALGPEHLQVAAVLHTLAILRYNQGEYQQAEAAWERAAHIQERALGSAHPHLASSLNGLAILAADQGKYEQAEALFQRVLFIREQVLGPAHPQLAAVWHNLALLSSEQGKLEQAERLFQHALMIWEQALGSDHTDLILALNGLASLYRKQGKDEQAKQLYERALHISERALGPEHPDVAVSLSGLASLWGKQGLAERAQSMFERALSIQERALGEHHLDTAETLCAFATFQEAQGNWQEALSLYQRALTTHEQVLGSAHPKAGETRTAYATLLQRIASDQQSNEHPC